MEANEELFYLLYGLEAPCQCYETENRVDVLAKLGRRAARAHQHGDQAIHASDFVQKLRGS